MKLKKYIYEFGIDSIKTLHFIEDKTSCFVSKDIKIGHLQEDEYIQLSVEYEKRGGSVEFYIIDGTKEIPILPVESSFVENEKIFYLLRTRFSIDTSKNITIKKNNIEIGITLDQAINDSNGEYTVSYSALNAYNIKTTSENVKLKAILRSNNGLDSPKIKNMIIKKFGRSSTWKSKTMN